MCWTEVNCCCYHGDSGFHVFAHTNKFDFYYSFVHMWVAATLARMIGGDYYYNIEKTEPQRARSSYGAGLCARACRIFLCGTELASKVIGSGLICLFFSFVSV